MEDLDYLVLNEKHAPFADVHVRRAISYAIDRAALVRAVAFGDGRPANSLFPPQVPYYDPATPGLTYDLGKARAELAKSSRPHGFSTTFVTGSGDDVELAIAQIVQRSLGQIGIKLRIALFDPNAVRQKQETQDYDIGHSYWTMDIADPDELVTFAVDPSAGAHSFYTSYKNPSVVSWAKEAETTFSTARRTQLYRKIQAQSASDAFSVFLYYSPYQYAMSTKVHGFNVYPTGNYHLEDVWLSR